MNIKQVVEDALDLVAGDNSFDKLVDLREEVQRMITAQLDDRRQQLLTDIDRLKLEVATKAQRLSAIEDLVSKPRAKRSDAGVKRPAKAKES